MEPRSKTHKIFFSYPRDENVTLVMQLKADIEKRGHTVWFDRDEIQFNDDWRERITKGIQESHLGVVFLSRHSTRKSGVCLNEIAIGIAEKGGADFWVSILLEPLDQAESSVCLESITSRQCLNMEDWQKYNNEHGWYREKLNQIVSIIENPVDVTRSIEIGRLRSCLHPQDFSYELDKHLRDFTGRQWILNRFDKWLDHETNSRVFRIEGLPGMGKTALALKLAHRTHSRVIALHLCRHNQADSRKAALMVKNLAFQIATKLPDYRKRLLQTPMLDEIDKLNKMEDTAGTLWRELIARPLAGLIERHRLAIVIDALDEANEDGNNEIVSLLAKFIDQLPSWIGVVFTCRPEKDIKTKLSRYKATEIKDDDPENVADMKLYIDKWLTKLVISNDLTTEQRQVSGNILLKRCAGSFLYLIQVRKAVEAQLCSLTQPERLPNTLADTYTLFFERYFGQNPSGFALWRDSVLPLLEIILASPEPLPLSVARKVLQWDIDAYIEERTLRSLGSLFPKQAKDTITPFHKSVIDWLSDKDKSGIFSVSVSEGHKRLAEFCWKECEKPLTKNMSLRDRYKSYHFRNGVRHLVADRRYAQALLFLDYLVEHETEIETRDRDNLRHSEKLFISALGESCIPEHEAKSIDPFKLQKMLEGLYMTAASRGGIQLLLEHHCKVWPELLERFLDTDDYVLRNTIAEALARDYQEYGKKTQLDDIIALTKHQDMNHQELGSYALGFIYVEMPDIIDKLILNQIANDKTYPFRSIVGDLLIGLSLKEYRDHRDDTDRDCLMGTELVDPSSLFWNPIWDFNKMDVCWLKAINFFVRHQSLPADTPNDVGRCFDSLVHMETLRQQLLEENVLGDLKNNPITDYYNLGRHLDYIEKALPEIKRSPRVKEIFVLFFAHPLWKVAEEAASALASIVDDEPDAGRYIIDLFEHDFWRVNYGASEAAFLARAANENQLFWKAIELFYKHPDPLLRGNCAENLVAWIIDCRPSKWAQLLKESEKPICHWLNDQDCWVLDHIYRLFHTLSLSKYPEENWKWLLDRGVTDILKSEQGEDPWYQVDRGTFLSRIEHRKRCAYAR